MDSMVTNVTGTVADSFVGVARVRTSLPVVSQHTSERISQRSSVCAGWQRSHASTRVMTTGGVRLLPATAGRLRFTKGAYGATSSPFSGPSPSSPPV